MCGEVEALLCEYASLELDSLLREEDSKMLLERVDMTVSFGFPSFSNFTSLSFCFFLGGLCLRLAAPKKWLTRSIKPEPTYF